MVATLLATSAGGALGAPYESQPPRGPELEVAMVLYGARRRHIDVDEAIEDVRAALPYAHPIRDLRKALRRLHPDGGASS